MKQPSYGFTLSISPAHVAPPDTSSRYSSAHTVRSYLRSLIEHRSHAHTMYTYYVQPYPHAAIGIAPL